MSERAATAPGAAGADARPAGRFDVDVRRLLRARIVREAEKSISPVAVWLLGAVALDLVVTRLALRLAVFVPRGDATAAAVGTAARVAAVVDALVPVIAVVVLGRLLVSAGAWRAPSAWGVGLVASAGAAAGGFALTILPPTPAGMAVLEGLVAIAAILLVVPSGRAGGGRGLRTGLVALGAATALAALARVADSGALLSGSAGVGAPSLALFLAGQLTFWAGGVIVGVAGFLAVARDSRPFQLGLAIGLAVASTFLAAILVAPATASILLIWSVGLSSSLLPPVIVAVTAGLALGGLVALASVRREPAVGLAIVLFAGYGLAASGLVLAGLLGLALAGRALLVASEAGRASEALGPR